jgi:GMP synthase-like glutamine amidotransferase
MKRLLCIQHTYAEFLGALEPQFEAREIGFSYVRTVAGQDVAGTPTQYDALWLLGTTHAVADGAHCAWLEDEKRLVRAFQNARRPVVGLGAGAHVLAAANGAALSLQPEHDAGFTTAVALDGEDPLAKAVDGRRVLVMACGSAALPQGARAVVADASGRCIAFRVGTLGYGLLFRPELKPGMLEDMAMEEDRPVPGHLGEMIETARAEWPQMQETTARVAAALVAALGLMDERRKPPVIGIVARS